MSKQNPQSGCDFPLTLSNPAWDALEAAGYSRLEQLTHFTAAEILKLHGMGPKGIRLLREAMEPKGMAFKKA